MKTLKMQKYITVSAEFRAFHRWKDAPDAVLFLRNWHRHVFKVTLSLRVKHNNRDLEFFIMQDKLRKMVQAWEGETTEQSCEMYAEYIALTFEKDGYPVKHCTVSEDGENSATVELSVVE